MAVTVPITTPNASARTRLSASEVVLVRVQHYAEANILPIETVAETLDQGDLDFVMKYVEGIEPVAPDVAAREP